MGRKSQHRFHGSPRRFDAVAEFIYDRFGSDVQYVADVGGGQGMLARILNKHYGYAAEVVDPRGWTLVGVPSRAEAFAPEMASYYDLIIGLHPDEATRAVAGAALYRPTLVVPCCNHWSEEKLGRDELVDAIADFYEQHHIRYERVTFDFKGPKNIGLISEPPAG